MDANHLPRTWDLNAWYSSRDRGVPPAGGIDEAIARNADGPRHSLNLDVSSFQEPSPWSYLPTFSER